VKFKDHFSGHAGQYARFRPQYPEALFSYLALLAPARELAWDCATGNGQAAIGLAAHFERVIATDASSQQIESAEPHSRVEYRVAPAENSRLPADSVDLVTVAQAVHWFDVPAFCTEAEHVLKPEGVIAVWAYNFLRASPEVDALVNRFYFETTAPYWPPERAIVESGFRDLEFPFEEITPPLFEMSAQWSLEQLLGYLRTWSATQKFIQTRGFDPVVSLGEELRRWWGDPEHAQTVRWPLSVRVGMVPA